MTSKEREALAAELEAARQARREEDARRVEARRAVTARDVAAGPLARALRLPRSTFLRALARGDLHAPDALTPGRHRRWKPRTALVIVHAAAMNDPDIRLVPFAASVLGVTLTPELLAAVREVVRAARSRGKPLLVEMAALPEAKDPALAPLFAAADEQGTPRWLALRCVLGTPCAMCGWPIEDGAPYDLADKGAAHPECSGYDRPAEGA